jgi:hypothetical protein
LLIVLLHNFIMRSKFKSSPAFSFGSRTASK